MTMMGPVGKPSRHVGPARTINKTTVKSFAVLTYLAGHGVSTINQVARALGLSRTTARRALDTLASVGLVTVETVHSPDTGVVTNKFYRFNDDQLDGVSAFGGDDEALQDARIARYQRRIAELEQAVADLSKRIATIAGLAAIEQAGSPD